MKSFLPFAAALAALAAAPAGAGQILISNVNVFDGVNEALIEKANVLVEGEMIAAISTDPISAGGR
ncbi:hypothetical protein PSA7680_01909 [Pseudoruegeria aquimaris]|uniref:Amidohydrolase n=1 Tax=Pseudoruegeria aquimaris TaxID=393663 RepID=A0A1Y5SE80_9RHOB|nr:hypothetical protein [Pseudoruegeria aquimaris]SLN38574.1 hypothetical protein PSA7680_01909 [Pseudoruegeria aquimaris]